MVWGFGVSLMVDFGIEPISRDYLGEHFPDEEIFSILDPYNQDELPDKLPVYFFDQRSPIEQVYYDDDSRSPYGSQQANERLIFDIGSSTPSSWLAPGCQIHSTA